MDNLNNWELNPGERDFNWDGAEQQIGDKTTETRLEKQFQDFLPRTRHREVERNMESREDFVIDDEKMYFYSHRNNLVFTEKCQRRKNR